MEQILNILNDTGLINNILLLTFFLVFGILFAREHSDASSPLRWIDMLVDTKTGKLSIAKVGNFIAVVVSTWIMIALVQEKESYSVLPSMFMAWLAFMGGVYTLNNFINKDNDK